MPIRASRRAIPQTMTTAQFERVMANASSFALLAIGGLAIFTGLALGKVILAPICLAIVVGLMFGPVAEAMERGGVPPALSAGAVLLLFIGVLVAAVALFAGPLSEWIARGPVLWEKLRTQLVTLKGPLESFSAIQEQLKTITGADAAMTVEVQGGGPVQDVALMAPAILADVLLFLAGLYFYLATRHQIRIAVLSLCFSRRMRWRTAHVFSDVESKISRFLLSSALINLGVGCATALAMYLLGVPSPLLWGALAAVMNFIPYVGQAVMFVILFAVGLGTQSTLIGIVLPVGAYAAVNLTADQIIFPHLVGRALTLNPFVIFVSIAFWLWMWGPIGGFIAVPSLLLLQSAISHILPTKSGLPLRLTRKAEREVVEDTADAKPNRAPPDPPAPATAKRKRAPRKPAIPASS